MKKIFSLLFAAAVSVFGPASHATPIALIDFTSPSSPSPFTFGGFVGNTSAVSGGIELDVPANQSPVAPGGSGSTFGGLGASNNNDGTTSDDLLNTPEITPATILEVNLTIGDNHAGDDIIFALVDDSNFYSYSIPIAAFADGTETFSLDGSVGIANLVFTDDPATTLPGALANLGGNISEVAIQSPFFSSNAFNVVLSSVSIVPEPASLTLLAAGGLAVLRRRRLA